MWWDTRVYSNNIQTCDKSNDVSMSRWILNISFLHVGSGRVEKSKNKNENQAASRAPQGSLWPPLWSANKSANKLEKQNNRSSLCPTKAPSWRCLSAHALLFKTSFTPLASFKSTFYTATPHQIIYNLIQQLAVLWFAASRHQPGYPAHPAQMEAWLEPVTFSLVPVVFLIWVLGLAGNIWFLQIVYIIHCDTVLRDFDLTRFRFRSCSCDANFFLSPRGTIIRSFAGKAD